MSPECKESEEPVDTVHCWSSSWRVTCPVNRILTYQQMWQSNVKRLKPSTALKGNPSQRYGASLAIWDHTVHMPRHNPSQPGWYSIYLPGGMEGWVDLPVGSLIGARPRIEPTAAWSQVRCPNRYTTESPGAYKCWCKALTYSDQCYITVNSLTLLSLHRKAKKKCSVNILSYTSSFGPNTATICTGLIPFLSSNLQRQALQECRMNPVLWPVITLCKLQYGQQYHPCNKVMQ